jgi:hypothetical protein
LCYCFVHLFKGGARAALAQKTAFSFCKAFSFAPFVSKEKAMWGVSLCLGFYVAFFEKKLRKKLSCKKF